MNVYIDRSGSTFECGFEQWAWERIQEIVGPVVLFGFSSFDVWHINDADDWMRGQEGTLVQVMYKHNGYENPALVLTDTDAVWALVCPEPRPANITVLARRVQ